MSTHVKVEKYKNIQGHTQKNENKIGDSKTLNVRKRLH